MTFRFAPSLRIAGTLLVLTVVTALDSAALAARFAHGQQAASIVTFAWWALLLVYASPRLRVVMVAGLVSATLGEAIFSLLLGMYEYRLANIPAYVPPGHTILYATVFLFVRRPAVKRRERWLAPGLAAVCALYSVGWWWLRQDTYGMVCFGAFALLYLAMPRSRLFFAAMYLLVAFLEQIGTSFGCWYWHATLLDRVDAMPSANPPSGVAVYYVVFDITCLALYFFVRFASFERFVRSRMAQRARLSGGGSLRA